MNITWLTTPQIETLYKLPKGSVRRDLKRNKFSPTDTMKIGRDWIINPAAAEQQYKK